MGRPSSYSEQREVGDPPGRRHLTCLVPSLSPDEAQFGRRFMRLSCSTADQQQAGPAPMASPIYNFRPSQKIPPGTTRACPPALQRTATRPHLICARLPVGRLSSCLWGVLSRRSPGRNSHHQFEPQTRGNSLSCSGPRRFPAKAGPCQVLESGAAHFSACQAITMP